MSVENGLLNKISDRTKRISAGERGELLKMAEGVKDLITLARGDPDLSTPGHIIDAAKKALDNGATHYTHWAGDVQLREAIAAKLSADNNIEVDPESQVLVTTGGQEAMFLVCLGFLNQGDEVLIADPHYMSYDTSVGLAGGKLVPVPTYLEYDFEISVDQLEKYWTPRCKMLVLVSPSNPTGSVVSPEKIREIAAWAREKDLIVLSDEIYEKLVYEDARHLSIASLPGMAERTITLNGFSKTYAMTGWRVGYIAAPTEAIRAFEPIKHTSTICAPAVSQAAALEAITGPQECVENFRQIYNQRREILVSLFDELGIPYGYPKGAFYLFAGVPVTGMSAMDFAKFLLLEAGVLVLPGSAFGAAGADYLRFSLVQPKEKLAEAVGRIREAAKRLL